MATEIDYEWRLRPLLADRGVFSSSELVPLLAEHGIRLSDTQVWRLVTGKPERLNLHTLMVLCEILQCTPNDLISRVDVATKAQLPKRAVGDRSVGDLQPKPARIRPARDHREQ